jgi:hypothetical protein
MSNHIERLMVRSHDERENGWCKTTNAFDPKNQKIYRSIKIGNVMNCNGEIIRDHTTYGQIKSILDKYNIEADELKQIEEKMEHAVELKLEENKYKNLISSIKSN